MAIRCRLFVFPCLIGLVLCAVAPAAEFFQAGQSYFGRQRYIEYVAGNLPVIISAPHGGRERPAELPDREQGTFAFDTNTQELARAAAAELHARTGGWPHVVICRLHRRKVDCNREIIEAAAGNPTAEQAWKEFEQTGRIRWATDLAEIPQKFGVTNVYADVGQLFAQSVVAEPRLGAALMGIMVKGLGADHVCWGTDAIWTGSPQWQIEALRRLEIPEDMQKKYGFAPLGGATGPVKTAIFSGNNMRLYGIERRTDLGDRFAAMKEQYLRNGPARSNLRYGYARRPEGWVAQSRIAAD